MRGRSTGLALSAPQWLLLGDASTSIQMLAEGFDPGVTTIRTTMVFLIVFFGVAIPGHMVLWVPSTDFALLG